ncbi:hypothetical protein RRG08_047739 [Elysia crispata]|uniref:C-type lectin domain-containing protein n=1 Tax=Elysia crispata TaxID=231223 RepID=A0AAE1DUD4_9GAST|nr:hypothetical protein RRG08_047739 [Elysia crispata]
MIFISCGIFLLALTASSANQTVKNSCPEKAVKTVENKYFRVRNDTCFLFMTYDRVVYETASDKCKNDGGTLAMPKTKDVNDFLIQEMRSFDRPWWPMWIGMNDKDVEGKIVWEDGTDVNAWGNFDWTNGGLFDPAEDCFALDPNNEKWHDYGCSNTGLRTTIRITGNAQLPFICQYPVTEEQDAVDQIDQVDQGDKAGQGDQGQDSANQTVENSCPEKAVETVGNKYFRVRNDTCFLFMTYDRVVYETASDKCKSNGGTLAMPKTKDVNDFLIQEIRSFDRSWQPMWIGMNDKDVEGKIVWEDGTDVNAWGNFDWTNGGLFGPAEDCFALDPNNEKWHDYGCSNTGLLTTVRITGNAQLPFICQYPVRQEQDAVDQGDQGQDSVDDAHNDTVDDDN